MGRTRLLLVTVAYLGLCMRITHGQYNPWFLLGMVVLLGAGAAVLLRGRVEPPAAELPVACGPCSHGPGALLWRAREPWQEPLTRRDRKSVV